MNINKTQLIALLLFSLLCPLSGCEQKKAPQPSYPEVRYMETAKQEITLRRNLPGRVRAFTTSEVRPQVSGVIQAKLFEEGADIQAGQILYRIDPALYQASFKEAKAALNKAEANAVALNLKAQRYSGLVKSGAVGKQDYDDALAAARQANAETASARETLETAGINLGYTEVRSPVSGRIGRSFVTEGALVTQNQIDPLAKIQMISPVNVDITQSSSQMIKLRQALYSGSLKTGGARSAMVRLYLEGNVPFMRSGVDGRLEWAEGELMFADISVDESTESVTMRAKFDNADGVLLPGMYVRAELIEGVLEDAILVPQKCIMRDARNEPQVLVLKPEGAEEAFKVEPRTVTLGREYDNNWIVTSGLGESELLVVDGLQKARPGQIVRGSNISKPLSLSGIQGR